MSVQSYFAKITHEYSTGFAREHSYRPALKELIESIMPDVTAINEPKHIACGAPDFILSRRKISVGYAEAKDIDASLDAAEKSEQLVRYLGSLDNFFLTDYLEFRFFQSGEKVATTRIAEVKGGKIIPCLEKFSQLESLLRDFAAYQSQTIKSAEELASMMAHKARLMKHVFYNVVSDEDRDSSLKDQLSAFQEILVHDMTPEQFSDVYAQTIAYGLFTARLHDKTQEDFTRSEALFLIPKSNPFLRQLFTYIAGPELDERAVWIVDALCEVFLYSDMAAILKDFGSATGKQDPMLHFYETFLAEYDPVLRKSRGVWYTPEPVVRFIIRAIDDVLKTHFNLKDGIADNTKIKIKVDAQAFDKRTKTGKARQELEVHKVQLLDVATGTGTFLAEAVKQIYKKYKGQEGIWSSYVENDLLPRLHGFELLMASYAMCHAKLDLLLQETGYKPLKTNSRPRLSVYLTNSLEEHHPESELPFASWLSKEANEASRIKRDMPIMVALGNPPYRGESANKGKWIFDLIEAYKKEPGGKIKLNERNAKWINDDYVKFIRLGEHYIEKNGEGILAYITNHSYLDNPTFRGMRWHLLDAFDDIYIVDLHGNAKKKEVSPDGSKDANVFDIQQGVAIIIAVKARGNNKKFRFAPVHHLDLYGSRQSKYDFLNKNSLKSTRWSGLKPQAPHYFFVPKDYSLAKGYRSGFSLNALFPLNSVGIVTARDKFCIHETRESLEKTIHDFASLPSEEARMKYELGKDVRDWKVELAQKELKQTELSAKHIHPISYRPFDNRWTYFTGKSKGFHCMPRGKVMQHMLRDNVALNVAKQQKSYDFQHIICHRGLAESSLVSNRTSEIGYSMPLYRYETTMGDEEQKIPNLERKIYAAIKKKIPDVTPESLFDYIYAVLHSPTYRSRYAEFLKSDFPRVPYPKDAEVFRALAQKGAELRGLHLMESDALDALVTTYPIAGDNKVTKPSFKEGRVYINQQQYFGGVPEVAWAFYIGGYQPAQKWLKDRKDRALSVNDIWHYQRIIVALINTDKLMKEIDDIQFLP